MMRAVARAHLRERQRLREIVVEIQPEHAGRDIRAFEVMPVVGRHEEAAAVLRVVIAVRARRILALHRLAVGTGPRADGRRGVGRPRQIHATDIVIWMRSRLSMGHLPG